MSQHCSGGTRELVVTCVKGEGKIVKLWALPLSDLDTVRSFENRLEMLKQYLDSSIGFVKFPLGFKCVVKSKSKHYRWCRAVVLAQQGYNTVLVRLLDYGNEERVLISDLRNIDDPIMYIPPQAIECILADIMPVANEWTVDSLKYFEQHLLYKMFSFEFVSEYMKIPVVRVANKSKNKEFAQLFVNEDLTLIQKETVLPPPVQLSYKKYVMEQNSIHLIKVSYFENAQKFYVQPSFAETELDHLMRAINRLPKNSFSSVAQVPAVNTPCLTPLSTKKCYYRAIITHIQQNQCKVFFVDYGFSEQNDIHELRVIPPEYLNVTAQAIRCSLPSDAVIDPQEFKHLVGYQELELLVIGHTSESYIVKLFFHGEDLLMLLEAAKSYIPQKLKINEYCQVTVSYVNNVSEFYCQLTHLKEHQNIISHILNTGYNFPPIFLNECTPGKPVCAKYSDNNLWYRARIIKVNHENDIEIFFVDFGNYDNVNLNDVRKIGPDLLKFPIQAFKCFLHETHLPKDSKTQDDAFDLIEQMTSGKNLLAHIKTFAEDEGYGITLYTKNSQLSINKQIFSILMSIPFTPVNDIEDVYVTSFDSSMSFFVQFEKIDYDKLANMQEEINTFYSGKQTNSFISKEGILVCVRFNEDDKYYRARVEKCKEGQCEVFFIDYGNRESIPVRDIHVIDRKFTQYPQFGTECSFENFASRVPSDKLSEVMLKNSFKLKMIRKEGEKWYVSPTENFPANAALLKLVKQLEGTSGSTKDCKYVSFENMNAAYNFLMYVLCQNVDNKICS